MVIRHSRTAGRGRQALLAMAYYVRAGENLAFPNNERVTGELGLSERTLQLGLRDCEQLGELQRQPQAEDYQRRRVYAVDPMFRRQVSLPGLGAEPGAEPGARPGAEADAPAGAPAPHARVGKEPVEPKTNNVVTPPAPPTGGSAETSSSGEITGPTPRAPLAQRAAARRSRRRRRRQELDAPVLPPASGSCPLDHCAGALSEATELATREWEKLELQLRGWVGEQVYEIWFASAHAHLTDDGVLELAFADPSKGTWVDGRYRVAIERRSGLQVRVVGCDRVRALSEVGS